MAKNDIINCAMKIELRKYFYQCFTLRNIFYQRSRISLDPSFGLCMSNIQYNVKIYKLTLNIYSYLESLLIQTPGVSC